MIEAILAELTEKLQLKHGLNAARAAEIGAFATHLPATPNGLVSPVTILLPFSTLGS